MARILISESAAAATPAANTVALYAKTDGKLYSKDDAGAETALGGGSSGAPFTDTTAIVQGGVDATKLLRFEVDGFTTATTRVLTPPNFDGTIATLAGTETLTNKTITAPVVSGGTIDNTAIGTTTRALGYFSALRQYIGGFAGIFTHANSADRTYTLPNFNGTLATLAGTETLTNKTINGTVNSLSNVLNSQLAATLGLKLPGVGIESVISLSPPGFIYPSPKFGARPGLHVRNAFSVRASAGTFVFTDHAAGIISGASQFNANDATSTWTNIASVAAAGNEASVRSATFNLVRTGHSPIFRAYIRTGSVITNVRYWIGLFSAAATNVDTLAGATQGVGVRFSTVAGDGGFVGFTKDATTQSVSSTISTIAASTAYLIEIFFDPVTSTAVFSVNETFTSLTTTLPATTTDMGYWIGLFTTDAVAKNIALTRSTCEYN